MSIEKNFFGKLPDGQETSLFTLKNTAGMEAKITDFGGILVALSVPDRNGKLADIVHGCDSLEGYLKGVPYFGAIIGRYGNRIAKGSFELDGEKYTLAINNGVNALHGGLKGFDKKVWDVVVTDGEEPSLKLTYLSVDGEEGYPGNLTTVVVYTLQKDNTFRIDYKATTDKATVLNITNHSYFNLNGATDVLEHEVILYADNFLPVDETVIPTGELKSVAGTPFDFTKRQQIGERINEITDEQIRLGSGYDHCFVLTDTSSNLRLAAEVFEPQTGRCMEVFTTEPGMQFYTANHLKGDIVGKNGAIYGRRSAFCVETQHFPDSPNKPNFPSTVLRPNEVFESTTAYKFSVK
ncbi:Aldose 1-epimerase [Emticicia aquatica]|uniref:Aldose 1-epimerase n=1 Tax=Emticicia aquatica TaxID=1681835 RepID=A0ABN8EV77_9BACT|nr:aldose epimerase family protein [Emticicia aquatica]CAH0995509.1 Aldose 1-epimerase [Emticicia aquatica]